MQVNSSLYGNTTELDRKLQKKVRFLGFHIDDYIVDLPFAKHLGFECHSIARAISMAIPELKVVDGVYLGLEWLSGDGDELTIRVRECSHSWLETPDKAIIDAYPPGFITFDAVLVVAKGMHELFGKGLYRPCE